MLMIWKHATGSKILLTVRVCNWIFHWWLVSSELFKTEFWEMFCSVIYKKTALLQTIILTKIVSLVEMKLMILEFCLTIDWILANTFKICSVCTKSLSFVIRFCGSFTNVLALKTLYCTLLRSKLEYASVLWYPIFKLLKSSTWKNSKTVSQIFNL